VRKRVETKLHAGNRRAHVRGDARPVENGRQGRQRVRVGDVGPDDGA
jgi:hypothetical protein